MFMAVCYSYVKGFIGIVRTTVLHIDHTVIRGASISFQTFFVKTFKIDVLLKIQYVITIHLMTNFYDFRFK